MCVSHKISVLITKKIFSCISLKLGKFSIRPILNPLPCQCVPFLENIFLSFNLTDVVKIRIFECSGKLNFCPGVGQGRAAGKHGQAPGCFRPDMLVVAAEGVVDVEQEDKVLLLLQMGLLAVTLEQLRGQQLQLFVM